MGKRDVSRAKVEGAWGDSDRLERLLLDGSGLPGPRANLELAAALADEFAVHAGEPEAWALACTWASIDAVEAPVQSRREYLPFCAVQALGAMHAGVSAEQRAVIRRHVTEAAADPRWRMRESAAMALQRVAESDFDSVWNLLQEWMASGSPELMRGALAALADRPLLSVTGRAELALEVADRACGAYAATDLEGRKQDPWRVLRKGLEFAPSVFVAAAPSPGFAMLRRWAESRDLDVRKIVLANVRKTRLARDFADEVEAVGQALAWSVDEGFTDP